MFFPISRITLVVSCAEKTLFIPPPCTQLHVSVAAAALTFSLIFEVTQGSCPDSHPPASTHNHTTTQKSKSIRRDYCSACGWM